MQLDELVYLMGSDGKLDGVINLAEFPNKDIVRFWDRNEEPDKDGLVKLRAFRRTSESFTEIGCKSLPVFKEATGEETLIRRPRSLVRYMEIKEG